MSISRRGIRHGLFLLFLAFSVSQSWAQQTIANGQVVSIPVSQTRVNVAVDISGNPIFLNGSPTATELFGNFSQLPQTIYDPVTGFSPGTYAPFPGNTIPISRLVPGGTFTSIGGAYYLGYIGTNQTVTVDGAGSALNIGSALSVGSAGTLTLTNGGAVNVGTLSGNVINAGAVSIGNGSSLSISQNFLFTGGSGSYVQTAGSTKVNGALNASSVSIEGGQFGGSGMVNGSVINSATVAPGDPQTLTINGDYTQNATGQLVIDIAGANDFDKLDVNGKVALSGDVDFDFINGYVPMANTQFSFLQTNGAVSGNFAAIDVNGLNCPTCSFNLSTLSFDTGSTAPTNAVPEPCAMALLAVGSIAIAVVRKRPKAL